MHDTCHSPEQLHIILGCMFSGKTTRLLTLYQQVTTKTKIIIGWSKDNRSNGRLKSHNPQLKSIKLDFCVNNLKEVLVTDLYKTAKHVFIDEGQFFEDLSGIIQIMVHEHRKNVYLSGLYSDYNGTPFINMTCALAHAQVVEFLTSKCEQCGEVAVYSCLKYYQQPLSTPHSPNSKNDGVVLVGGGELYTPRCARHRTSVMA